MKLAEKKQISWGLFVIAFIFLFNPNIAIIDPFPDFFGYIILSFALSKLAMIDDRIYEAKRAFDRMIIVDIGKIIAIFWVFGVEAVDERNTSLLLWSFVFGVLEILFAVSAFTKLYEGLSSLGDFHSNFSIHGTSKHSKKSYTQKIKIVTVFFIIFKAILTCLPELSVLGTASYDETSSFLNLYRYIGLMRGFCFIPVFIAGVIFLICAIRYFLRIKSDIGFVNELNDEYSNKKLVKSGLFVIRDVKIATLFLVLGSVLTFDFNVENVNVIPDILVVIAISLSLFYFSKVIKFGKKFIVGILITFSAVTLFEQYLKFYFFDNFKYNAISKNEKAFYIYIAIVAAVLVEGVLLVIMYSSIAKAIKPIIKEHTGYVLGKEIHTETEQKQIEVIHNRLSKNFSRLADFAAICALADLFYSLYGAFYAFLDKNYGWMSLVSVAAGLLLVGMTVKAVSELRESVQTKYMLQ